MEYLTTLRQVLIGARDLPLDARLFLPFDAAWSLETPCSILNVDDDGAPSPFAVKHGLEDAMDASEVWDIVANARAQRPDASPELLLRAFLYYFDNNALVDFDRDKI